MAVYQVSPLGPVSGADGLSWETAYRTLTAALSGKTDGHTYVLDGGVSGITYTGQTVINVGATVIPSTEEGHNGRVTCTGRFYFNAGKSFNIGAIYQKNGAEDCFSTVAGCVVVFDKTKWYGCRPTGFTFMAGVGAVVIFNDCEWGDNLDVIGVGNWRPMFFTAKTGGTYTFNRPIFRYMGLQIAGAGNITINNPLILGAGSRATYGSSGTMFASRQAGQILTFNNAISLGQTPVWGTAGDVYANNCFWHPHVWAAQLFDTGADGTNCLNSALLTNPRFVNGRDCTLGQLMVTIDDSPNTQAVEDASAILNLAGIKTTLSVNLHSQCLPPTAAYVNGWRRLVRAGNEIRSHGSTHSSNAATLYGLSISATGTSPTIAITGTRTGDSTTWSGTLTATINSVPLVLDLASGAYNTLAKVIAALNGTALGNGVITCSRSVSDTGAKQNLGMLSLVLRNISGSIATSTQLLLDDAAFARFELVECVSDLNSYMRNGADRNGVNPLVLSEPPIPDYVCKTHAMAYGDGRETAAATLSAIDGIIGAVSSVMVGTGTRNIHNAGEVFDPFQFPYVQTSDDPETFATSAYCATGPFGVVCLWHGTPLYEASVGKLRDLLLMFGLGTETMSEFLERLQASSDFTKSSKRAWSFVGDIGTYIGQGDFHLRTGSPLIGNGTKITEITTDTEGNPLYPPYNIGPFSLEAGALDVAPVANDGPPRNNITRLTGTSATIDPAGTYILADTNAWRTVTGWTEGTANDFFDEDGVPIPFTGQQAIDAGIGPRFYVGLKEIAGYTVDQNAAANAKIIRISKVPTYIDTLYWSDSAEMDWSASNE